MDSPGVRRACPQSPRSDLQGFAGKMEGLQIMRFEVTGGNGRGAKVSEIQDALRAAGAMRVGSAYAYGWSNQPRVATFSAESEIAARAICRRAFSFFLYASAAEAGQFHVQRRV